MGQEYVILHLSDAHIGNPKHSADASSVLSPLLRDLKDVKSQFRIAPNLIVFNGDLAFGEIPESSLSNQYAIAKTFLDDVYQSLETEYELTPILLVPGNHDINRNLFDTPDIEWLSNQTGEAGAQKIYEFQQTNGRTWRRFLEHQEAWAKFAKSLPGQPWLWNDNFYNCHARLKFAGIELGIAGLNSSWGSHTQREKDKLWIGKFQLQRTFESLQGCDFKIIAAHHPTGWLNDAEENWIDQRIETNSQIFLHGHDHQPWLRDSTGHLMVAAGAAYQGSTKPNGYAWIRLNFDERRAQVIFRAYSDAGAGGWIPMLIPRRTNNEGICEIEALFAKSQMPSLGTLANQSSETQASQRRAMALLSSTSTTNSFISTLDDRFGFRWEPSTFPTEPTRASVYWPVILRAPTPIHAIQCFAAAGLQKLGNEVVLWVDELGSQDHPLDAFSRQMREWFSRSGGDASTLQVKTFSGVVDREEVKHAWPLVQKWLGKTGYKLDDVLKVSKLLAAAEDANPALTSLLVRRPRRLLTPAMVWTCLTYMHEGRRDLPIITLGGYDERSLWQAWRDCAELPSAKIGHLYVPQLNRSQDDDSSRPLHMSRTNLAWRSKEDIRDALSEGLRPSTTFAELARGSIIPWCVSGCILLPEYVNGSSSRSTLPHINNAPIQSVTDLATLTVLDLLQSLVELLADWLL